jgi:hypothetical protein
MPNEGALAVDANGNVWAWGDDIHGVDCMGTTQVLTPVQRLERQGFGRAGPSALHRLLSGHPRWRPAAVLTPTDRSSSGWPMAASGLWEQRVWSAWRRRLDESVPSHPSDAAATVTYTVIAMSGATASAVDSNGNVWSWGWDVEGQVGNGVKRRMRC